MRIRRSSGSLAKTSPPRLPGVLLRPRLFGLLDRRRTRPLVWVTGPPGAGKTTLVSSYLVARSLRTLWYQVDQGDSDLATFFYYLRQAARRVATRARPRLPTLTPEYRAGVSTFARQYFRRLYQGLRPPFVLVLDNYQEAPPGSRLHEVVRDAVDELPRGGAIVVVSRSDPPPELARIRAAGTMEIIAWDALRLTAREAAGIMRLRGRPRLPRDQVGRLHDRTQGWAAGLVLLLERAKTESMGPEPIDDLAPQAVFDYLADEVFGKADRVTQQFLLRTAFLPEMTARMAAELTGVRQADRILSELSRRSFFTERRSRAEPVYQFHPLFREFLLARAGERLTTASLAQVRRQAGALMAGVGEVEQAVALLHGAEDWDGVATLVLTQAPGLLAQGRNQTLEEWIRGLPIERVERNAWLQYWLGTAQASFSPARARQCFELAFRLFREDGDETGTFSAWSGVVETTVLEWEDFTVLDHWIGVLETLRNEYPRFPSEEIEARVSYAMVRALMWRQPYHSDISAWAERAFRLSQRADVNARVLAGSALINYCLWVGQQARAATVLEGLRDLAQSRGASPLVITTYRSVEATYHWHTASPELCRHAAAIGLETARTSGVHIVDPQLHAGEAYGALIAADLPEVRARLGDMRVAAEGRGGLHAAHYHFLVAWEALIRGDLPSALEHTKVATAHADKVGVRFAQVWNRIGMAHIQHELGEHREAAGHLAEARRLGADLRSLMLDYMFLLAEAHFAFREGNNAEGLSALRSAMTLGRRQGFLMTRWWRPSMMAGLCARALEARIEVEYAEAIVRHHRLAPDAPSLALESWPWPVQVYALGAFRLLKNGRPVRFSGKVQQRPIEMLKVLIAFGPRGVVEEQLADVLWPDGESDAAHQAVATTLHRLRALIGPESIVLRGGLLTLDRHRCWVDAWAFMRLLEDAEALQRKGHSEEAQATTERALSLYREPLLAADSGEAWLISPRERYRRLFLRHVGALGRRLEASGEWSQAVDWYARGLEVDDLAEQFYQRLMACYHHLGRRAEGLAAYQRCRTALASGLRVTPSADTEALHRALRAP